MSKGEKILQIAKELFLKHGYANVSVSHITNALGISKGSFYTYFSSKTEMILQIIEEKKKLSQERHEKTRRSSTSFEESLRNFLWHYFQKDASKLEMELVVINLMMYWDVLEEDLTQALLDCERSTILYWEEELKHYEQELSIEAEEGHDYAVFITKLIYGFIVSNLFLSEEQRIVIKDVGELMERIESQNFEKKVNFLMKNILKMLQG